MARQIISNRSILTLGQQNLLTYSSKIDSWTNENTTVALDQHINPKTGLLTMDQISDDATVGHHKRSLLMPNIRAFDQFTVSALLRNNTRRYAGFYFDSGSTNIAGFDLQNGVVALSSMATQMFAWDVSIDEVLPDNTYRVKLTFIPRINLAGSSISVFVHDVGNTYHFYGGDGSSIFVDEIQVNRGNKIQPYKLTTGSAFNSPARSRAVRNLI